MTMTWRRPEGKQEAWEGEGIFQLEEVWITIKQEDSIVHPLYSFSFITIQHLVAPFRMGDPRSSILVSSVTLTSGSISLKLLSTREKFSAARPTLIISVFFGLASRPIRLSPVMHNCTSLTIDSGEPPIVVSSIYQTDRSDCNQLEI